MKVSKFIKGATLAAFGVLIIAAGAFADIASCVKENYSDTLSTSKNNKFPIKCVTVAESQGNGKTKNVTIYGAKSSDCAQAGSIASNPDNCSSDLNTVIRTIINAIIFVVGMVAVIMIILGGVNYATSQGDPGKVKKGKDTIMYGIIGLVISILAFAIVNFVLQALQN